MLAAPNAAAPLRRHCGNGNFILHCFQYIALRELNNAIYIMTTTRRAHRRMRRSRRARTRSRKFFIGGNGANIINDVVKDVTNEYKDEIANVGVLTSRIEELAASVQSKADEAEVKHAIAELNRAVAELTRKVTTLAKREVNAEVGRRPNVDLEVLVEQSEHKMDVLQSKLEDDEVAGDDIAIKPGKEMETGLKKALPQPKANMTFRDKAIRVAIAAAVATVLWKLPLGWTYDYPVLSKLTMPLRFTRYGIRLAMLRLNNFVRTEIRGLRHQDYQQFMGWMPTPRY
jgi:uncharacterized protein YoxC